MDCRTVRELADSFLSEQLLVETNHEVLRHLETCAACRAELDARGAIRQRLRGAFDGAVELQARQDFAAELAHRLRPSAHAVSQEASHAVSRRSLLRSWWAAAAGLVLAAGGGTLAVRQVRSRAQLVKLATLAAGDHQNCAIAFHLAEQPIALQDAARRFGMPYGQMASFQLPPLTPAPEMLARHSCVYDGHRFAHLVVRYHGAVTSLLVTQGDGPATPRIETSNSAPAVASLSAGDFVAFLVADLPADEVLQLAQTIAPALERHLSA